MKTIHSSIFFIDRNNEFNLVLNLVFKVKSTEIPKESLAGYLSIKKRFDKMEKNVLENRRLKLTLKKVNHLDIERRNQSIVLNHQYFVFKASVR